MAKMKKIDTTNNPNRNNQLNDDRKNNDTMHESTIKNSIENSETNAPREQEANSNTPASDDVKKQDDIKKEVEQKEPESEKKETPGNSDKKNRKKSKRPTSVFLSDKSELFTEIIDIAFACERLEKDKRKLIEKNAVLKETREKLTEENGLLNEKLKEVATLYQAKLDEINELKTDIAQRNEVIDIVKADKSESAQEYKNALAAALKTYYTDFVELKEMGTSDDVGLAVIETFDEVIKVLEKNGIAIEK